MIAAGRSGIVAAPGDAPVVPEGWTMAMALSERAVVTLVRAAWDEAYAEGRAAVQWDSAHPTGNPPVMIRLAASVSWPTVRLDVADRSVDVAFDVNRGLLYRGVIEPDGVEPDGVEPDGVEPDGVEPDGGEPDGGEPDGVEPDGVEPDTRVVWSDPIAIDTSNALRLVGAVPLRVDFANPEGAAITLDLSLPGFALVGDVGAGQSRLDVGAGRSPLNATSATIADRQGDPVIGASLTLLSFATQPEASVLQVGTISVEPVAMPDGTAAMQVLAGSSSRAGIPEAVPIPSYAVGHDFGLAIGSQATMTLIANSYNAGSGDIKLMPVPPAAGQNHWRTQVHQPMVFDGRFGNSAGATYVHDRATMYMRFGGSSDRGLALSTEIDPSSTIQLQLDLQAHFPVAIEREGSAQVIRLRAGDQSVSGAGFYESIVRPQLATFLHGDIRRDMAQVRITEVDALVRQVVRLPRHVLRFDGVALPGELLLVGTLAPA